MGFAPSMRCLRPHFDGPRDILSAVEARASGPLQPVAQRLSADHDLAGPRLLGDRTSKWSRGHAVT